MTTDDGGCPETFDGRSAQNDRVRRTTQYRIRQALHRFCLPGRLWKLSCVAYRRGWHPVAVAIKAVNYIVFKAILPYECDIPDDVFFEHQGLGCAFSHTVTLGKRVHIGHSVSIAALQSRVIVGDDVEIGMHASILGNPQGGIRRIGNGAKIGACTIVMQDVPDGASVIATPSRVLKATTTQ